MSLMPTSARTILRQAVLDALAARKGMESMREPAFEVVKSFLTEQEIKRDVSYGVIVTDETPEPQTMTHLVCTMTLLIVIYVRDDTDARARLDAAIEDVYETVLSLQSQVNGTIWKLTLDAITTDEGTIIAKPYAQALQRWRAVHRRAAVAA